MSTKNIQVAKYDPISDRIVGSAAEHTLLSVCFEPTNLCPGRCPYCLIEDHRAEATTSQLQDVLRRLLDHGTLRIGFGGGEPLIRDDVFDLGMLVRAADAGSLLRTSGMYLMDPERTRESFDWIDISFDSINELTFKRCRPGVPYDVVTQNIRELASTPLLRVSILLTERNASSAMNTVAWLADAGVVHLRMQRLVRRGKARTTWGKLKLAADHETELMNDCIEHARALGMSPYELTSLTSPTLCIVKSDGSLHIGMPTGLVEMGTTSVPDDLTHAATLLSAQQRLTYSSAAHD